MSRAGAHGQDGASPSTGTLDLADAGAAGLAPLGAAFASQPRLRSSPRNVLTPRRVVALQRKAGNRAVASAVNAIVQRVDVKAGRLSETLYNQSDNTGQATAKKYGLNSAYQMVRNGDSGVTVTVRIKFLSQSRNGIDPNSPTAPPDTPELGALVDKPAEIPADDERRAWAEKMAREGSDIWNGRLTLVGEERNVLSENTKKRLPVTFTSKAVFGIGEEADSQVIVHPSSVVAGTPGQKIDAGNWYVNKGNYGADEKVITAHEYGHLLGIPDEYSQSNEQLNALIHQAAPGTAPSAGAKLDRETVQRMVLVSMRQPLMDQLEAAMPTMTDALQAAIPLVKKKMTAAARNGVVSGEVREELRAQLAAASEEKQAGNVPQVVAFQTTTNFSNRTLAGEGVELGFAPRALSRRIRDTYRQALLGAEGAAVDVKGLGAVSIRVHGSASGTTAAGGANAPAAGGVSTSVVGAGGTPGLPAISPPDTLVGQISALPTAWTAAGSALEAGVTAGAFAAKMLGALKSAAAAAAAPPPGAAAPAKHERYRELAVAAHQLVQNAAREAARQVAAELLDATVKPILLANVTDFQSKIEAEVKRVMTTPPSGIPALGPADPNMAALVSAMKARLDADKAETKGTGRDPLGAGKAAPGQDVTYSYQGLMGSSTTKALRPDQFDPMVRQFNSKLTSIWEKPFKPEVK